MLNISQRAKNIAPSPIRKFEPLMNEVAKEGTKIYKLHIGDPDLEAPKEFFDAIKNYKDKRLSYAPTLGIKDNINAWIKYYADFGIKISEKNIIPTVGGSEAIIFSIMAVADTGDEIIIFEPFFSSYKGFAVMTGVRLTPVSIDVSDLARELARKITKKTKAIVIINPDNPTGKVWNEKELNIILKIAKENHLFIIADETYREIVFEKKPVSLLAIKGAREIVIVVDSVSKRFSIPGARIGCVVSFNKNITQSIFKFATMRLSVATLEQIGVIPLLNNSSFYSRNIVAEYKKRRDIVVEILKNIPNIKYRTPQGAFYITVKLPIKNADDFIIFLLRKFRNQGKTVMVAPLQDFYMSKNSGRNEIRIAYVLKPAELKKAMQLFKIGLKSYLWEMRKK